jgi:hypothetical protein
VLLEPAVGMIARMLMTLSIDDTFPSRVGGRSRSSRAFLHPAIGLFNFEHPTVIPVWKWDSC